MGFRTIIAAALAGAAVASPDEVTHLPGYGKPKTKQYSGFADATPNGDNKLFYWFVEADVGSNSAATPLLLWFNGGPGASSLIGLLAENLGPQKIMANGTLADNEHAITKKYHLMAIDNPVGAGFSYTKTGSYVKSEEEMRTQVVHALRGFYKMHPEYRGNPVWVTGESYGGKYVPNVGYELAVNATDIPFQGVVVGNGLYNSTIQYATVGEFAFGNGIIDERVLKQTKEREQMCLKKIQSGWNQAGQFCENATVRWLYTGEKAVAGQLFYYDFGLTDMDEFDDLMGAIGKYMNRDDVKKALHVSGATWISQDETGPVAVNLAEDFTRPSAAVVAKLLETGKSVVLYNGVRDGSVCNHIGNLKAMLAMQWSGSDAFVSADNKPWPAADNVMGHIRHGRNLAYVTVMRTGHLVPTVVPESFAVMLDMVLTPPKDALIV